MKTSLMILLSFYYLILNLYLHAGTDVMTPLKGGSLLSPFMQTHWNSNDKSLPISLERTACFGLVQAEKE